MHGLFQNPAAAGALLSYLAAKKGLPFIPIPSMTADPYDTLADLFEKHVDMDAVVALLDTKPLAGSKN
jgi:adenosylcobyric acid synthase